MVYVFPLPVYPYAKTLPLTPYKLERTIFRMCYS